MYTQKVLKYLIFIIPRIGAPVADENHCERICDMALDMIDASMGIKDPSQGEKKKLLFHSFNI